jgi:hypothetical protein
VSSDRDLERLLREGWKNVPEPDGGATRDARRRALSAARRRPRRRVPIAALVGTAVVVAIALGVGIGTFVAPSGTAARGPFGFGFLPEAGWYALQSATPKAPGQPRVTMAANVPFASEDVVNGLAEPSSLPYTTLLTLPPRGVIVIATFTGPEPWAVRASPRYAADELPLDLRDATPYIEYGTQIRPDEPLGQYQLRALVEGWYVDVHVYFGTARPSPALFGSARRQLRGLVAQPAPARRRLRAKEPARAAQPGVLDQSFSCSPGFLGGTYQVEPRVRTGSGRSGALWKAPAFGAIGTSARGAAAWAVENNVAWISAGKPSAEASVAPGYGSVTFEFRTWGTVAVNRALCRTSSSPVPFGVKGMIEREVGPFESPYDCSTPRRVLVRVRAAQRSAGRLTSFRGFWRTTAPARSAELVVRTPAGAPLAFARVHESGQATFFTAKRCMDD